MSCGCAIVSTATGMIPEIVKHGYNGLISNDPKEIAGYVSAIRNDPDLAKKLSENATKTIQNDFSLNAFVERWNEIFLQAEIIGEKAK
jgi:glycosyltransferase involved in cell wall biosynthesis